MLKRLELCFDHRRFVRNVRALDFTAGINLVVGPNGSGKSSVLKAIQRCPDCKKIETAPTKYHYYDGELMNPHRKDMTGNSLLRCRAMFASHGETLRDVLGFIPLGRGDTLLLDEPETGQDVEWMLKISRGFRKVARLGCQLIVATHHPVFLGRHYTVALQRGYEKKLFGVYTDVLASYGKG